MRIAISVAVLAVLLAVMFAASLAVVAVMALDCDARGFFTGEHICSMECGSHAACDSVSAGRLARTETGFVRCCTGVEKPALAGQLTVNSTRERLAERRVLSTKAGDVVVVNTVTFG